MSKGQVTKTTKTALLILVLLAQVFSQFTFAADQDGGYSNGFAPQRVNRIKFIINDRVDPRYLAASETQMMIPLNNHYDSDGALIVDIDATLSLLDAAGTEENKINTERNIKDVNENDVLIIESKKQAAGTKKLKSKGI